MEEEEEEEEEEEGRHFSSRESAREKREGRGDIPDFLPSREKKEKGEGGGNDRAEFRQHVRARGGVHRD